MAGIVVTASDIHLQAGTIARDLDSAFDRALELKAFLDQFTAADLETTFGVQSADGNLIKSAYNGTLDAMISTFRAGGSEPFLRQLRGMGNL